MLAVFIHLDDTAPGGFFQIHLAYHQVFCILNLIIVLAHPASQSASEWTCVLHSNFHSLLVIISLRRFCRSHCKILDINWIWYWQGRCTCTWEEGEVFFWGKSNEWVNGNVIRPNTAWADGGSLLDRPILSITASPPPHQKCICFPISSELQYWWPALQSIITTLSK